MFSAVGFGTAFLPPPIKGPTTDAMPYMPPTTPMYSARFSRGATVDRMRIAPAKIPAEPSPAYTNISLISNTPAQSKILTTARPMIKAVELGAAPHTAEPTSKMPMATR